MKNKFKTLYEFAINKKESAEEVTDNGDGTKTVKQVTKETPYQFCIKRPSRADYEDAELFYNASMGKAHNNGLISHALLAKRLDSDGGLISAPERESLVSLEKELLSKRLDLEKLEVDKTESADNPEKIDTLENYTKQKSEITEEILKLENKLTEYTRNYGNLETSVMQVTAESWARNQLVTWWMLLLTHKKDNDWVRLFPEEEHKDRKIHFFELEDEENDKVFNTELIYKATLAVAYWVRFGMVSDEELKKLDTL